MMSLRKIVASEWLFVVLSLCACGGRGVGGVDAGGTGGSGGGDAGAVMCPASVDGCNRAVGTIGAESFVVTHACPAFGAWVQSVWLANYPMDGSCVATMGAAPGDRALELVFEGTAPPAFKTGYWYPAGHWPTRTEASGAAVMDRWEASGRGRMLGTFDLRVGNDRLCGCFDAVGP